MSSWKCSVYLYNNLFYLTILLTKITAAQNGIALSYHCVRGIYFLAGILYTLTIVLAGAAVCYMIM